MRNQRLTERVDENTKILTQLNLTTRNMAERMIFIETCLEYQGEDIKQLVTTMKEQNEKLDKIQTHTCKGNNHTLVIVIAVVTSGIIQGVEKLAGLDFVNIVEAVQMIGGS